MCDGIGFEQSVLTPYLHGPTLAEALEEHFPEVIPLDELEEKHRFSTLSNEKQVDLILDEYVTELDEKLPGLLIQMDHKQVLCWATNGDGEYYLLYPPRYPWQESGGFKSQADVIEYIRCIAQLFCRDDVTEEEVRALIDPDVYEVGCG
jgi:hypothetical protein